MPATLHIIRSTWTPDAARAYRVVVDGKTIGQLRPKKELETSLEEGKHQLSVRVDWCGSRPLSIDVRNGETVFLECGSNLANWRFLIAIVYITFLCNDYLWLRIRVPNQSLDPTLAPDMPPAGQEARLA
jgi:hypothetical protein